jgi:hypothetical protein
MNKLDAGKYPLAASKRGFRTSYYDEHDEFNTAIVTGEGQDTSSVVFELAPGAVLHGVVTGDGGDGVEDAQVMLFRRRAANTSGEPAEQAGSTATDDTGAYEFSNLAPGEYMVVVRAEPWFAQHPQGIYRGQAAVSSLDVAYPITFFDSTADEDAATPIALAAGDRQEANIALRAVPAVHLRATIPARVGRGSYQLELRQSAFGRSGARARLSTWPRSRSNTTSMWRPGPTTWRSAIRRACCISMPRRTWTLTPARGRRR